MSKYDFKRRRAISCKFIEKSKTSPGYLKYEITICELDGTTHTEPAYGKDMQDAISRLINKERTVKVEKKFYNYPFLLFLAWISVMSWPALIFGVEGPTLILSMFGGTIVLTLIGTWWYNYIDKK